MTYRLPNQMITISVVANAPVAALPVTRCGTEVAAAIQTFGRPWLTPELRRLEYSQLHPRLVV